MPIITLTTDLGLRDYYVSAIKAAIIGQIPDITIVDITHEIEPFNIHQAAFNIRNSYRNFPKGTVHIIGVYEILKKDGKHFAMEVDGHFFVGPDNGIFSLVFDMKPDKIVEINIKPEPALLTFPAKDIYVKAACHIARGGTLEIIGSIKDSISNVQIFQPSITSNAIRGIAVYIDRYGNIITNITQLQYKEVSQARRFTIYSPGTEIDTISTNYFDVGQGEALAMFNSSGFLEIAINKGNASNLLGIKISDNITIDFE